MKIRVLGSAAGGGFPQWNCNCRNCAGVRASAPGLRARTQSSLAVCAERDSQGRTDGQGRSEAGSGWALVNASPDILSQLRANPDLQPARAIRDTGIVGIVLVDGQVDHTAGLLMLRESTRSWPLWCTDSTHVDLTSGNPVLGVLAHFCGVERHRIDLDGQPFTVSGVSDVFWSAVPVASKPAPYSPNREKPVRGDNIALSIKDTVTGGTVLYAPGLGAVDQPVWRAMQRAACVLVDGTFWRDDEMIELGLSGKRAQDIGHLAQTGAGGMLEWLQRLPASTRKILVHINNTNPILDERSPQRAQLHRLGVEVAEDGMEIRV